MKPWKFEITCERKFKEQADTGDLILFQSIAVKSQVKGQFDHVAMVLKFETEPDEVFLIEATPSKGVSLTKWSLRREDIGPY